MVRVNVYGIFIVPQPHLNISSPPLPILLDSHKTLTASSKTYIIFRYYSALILFFLDQYYLSDTMLLRNRDGGEPRNLYLPELIPQFIACFNKLFTTKLECFCCTGTPRVAQNKNRTI